MVAVTPIVAQDGKHIPAPAGSTLDSSLVPLSTDTGNTLTTGSDGGLFVPSAESLDPASLVSAQPDNQMSVAVDGKLYVPEPDAVNPADLVSAQADNSLAVALDGKLYVPEPAVVNPADLISADAGNQTQIGTDGKLFTPAAEDVAPADLISADADNQLVAGTDGKLFVPEQTATEAADLISTDTGNVLSKGSDDKLFTRAVSVDADNLIKRGSDNAATLTASDLVSAGTAENLLKVDATDKRLEVDKADVLVAVKTGLTIVSDDNDNLIRKGTDGGAFLSEDALPDQVTAGVAVTVNDGRVSVNVGDGLKVDALNQLALDPNSIQTISLSATEQILALTSGGVLSATLTPQYDALTGNLTLYGKDSAVVGRVYIPGAASALKTVETVTNPTGYEAGTYFKFTWTTVSGDSVVYVKVPSTQTVNAGNGIEAVSSGDVITVSAKVKADGGLTNSAAGLAADFNLVAAKSDLDALEDRVDTAEGNITNLDDRVDALEAGSSSITVITGSFDPASLTEGTGALVPASDLLS